MSASPPLTSTARYRPATTLASVVVVLLGLNMLASLLGIASDFVQVDLARDGVVFGEGAEDAPFDTREIVILLIALFELLVFVPTVVIFCVWMYRAHKNLVALGNPRQHLEHPPGWAVGSFFVPIINLFVPYRAAREIWAKSDPEVTTFDTPFARYALSAPSVLKLWWGFWVASNILNNVSFRLSWSGEGVAAATASAWVDLFANILEIPAALFAIAVVRGVVERQERRARLVNYVDNVPPPPPIFSPQTVPSPFDAGYAARPPHGPGPNT